MNFYAFLEMQSDRYSMVIGDPYADLKTIQI